MTSKKLTLADQYRQKRAESQVNEVELVTLTLPSGFQIVFERPSRFDMIFKMGQLPLASASAALAGWKAEGGATESEEDNKTEETAEEKARQTKLVFDLRDRVLRLSHKPKLVVGIADEEKGELSTSDVSDQDLGFLFKFVASGGNASSQLATFSGGPEPGADPRPNRKGRRAAAKSASRA